MMYRVRFFLDVPLSDQDVSDFMRMNGGGEVDHDAAKEFEVYVRAFDRLEVVTQPMSLEAAMTVKLRFNGEMQKVKKID